MAQGLPDVGFGGVDAGAGDGSVFDGVAAVPAVPAAHVQHAFAAKVGHGRFGQVQADGFGGGDVVSLSGCRFRVFRPCAFAAGTSRFYWCGHLVCGWRLVVSVTVRECGVPCRFCH